ncbi:unnamed protein product, partial [Timema podura]|nr:unnamed protein product [Timema podura]
MANETKVLEDSNISTISMKIKKRQNISKCSDSKYSSKISKMLKDVAPNMEQKISTEKKQMEQITEGVLEGFDNKMDGLCESHAKERKKCVEDLKQKMSPVLDELQQQLAIIEQTGTKLLETVDQQLAEIKTVRETNMVKMAALRYMHSSFKQVF